MFNRWAWLGCKFRPMLVTADPASPPVEAVAFDDRWGSLERALVTSWLRGREMSRETFFPEPGRISGQELAAAAVRGELPELPWKGGVTKALKGGKVGALQYLAMWQGLRGDHLRIETDAEPQLRCTLFGVAVTFTSDLKKLGNAEGSE